LVLHQARSKSESDFSVALDTGVITVFVSFTVVAAVKLTVAKTRAVVFRGFLISAAVAVIGGVTFIAVATALLDTFVIAGIQSRLSQLEGTAIVAVIIPTAASASLITVPVGASKTDIVFVATGMLSQ
jgi:hypothetical protein